MRNQYRRSLLIILPAALIFILAVGSAQIPLTGAYFSDLGKVPSSFSMISGLTDSGCVLTPGKSRSTWPHPSQPPRIASIENGNLRLDFGSVEPGNRNNSPDVFRIKNTSNSDKTISLSLSPEFDGYLTITDPINGFLLLSGKEICVAMKLQTTPATPAGVYSGSLTVNYNSGLEADIIPFVFQVLSK